MREHDSFLSRHYRLQPSIPSSVKCPTGFVWSNVLFTITKQFFFIDHLLCGLNHGHYSCPVMTARSLHFWEEALKAGSRSCERSLDVKLTWLLPKKRQPVTGGIWTGIKFKLQQAPFLLCYWTMGHKLVPNDSVSYPLVQGGCSYHWSPLLQTDDHALLCVHTSVLALLLMRSFIHSTSVYWPALS